MWNWNLLHWKKWLRTWQRPPKEIHLTKFLNHKFKKRNYITKCGTHWYKLLWSKTLGRIQKWLDKLMTDNLKSQDFSLLYSGKPHATDYGKWGYTRSGTIVLVPFFLLSTAIYYCVSESELPSWKSKLWIKSLLKWSIKV